MASSVASNWDKENRVKKTGRRLEKDNIWHQYRSLYVKSTTRLKAWNNTAYGIAIGRGHRPQNDQAESLKEHSVRKSPYLRDISLSYIVTNLKKTNDLQRLT